MPDRGEGDQEGAVMVEYGFLLVFVVTAIAIGAAVLGLALAGVFDVPATTIGEADVPTRSAELTGD